MQTLEGAEGQLHSFLTLTLDVGDLSLHPRPFYVLLKISSYPVKSRLVGSQISCGNFGRKAKSLVHAGNRRKIPKFSS
jgi:hypothetical protein